MKSRFRLLLLTAILAPLAASAAGESRDAREQAPAVKRADLVDCRDYRGALRRVGDKCVRPMGVTRVYTREDLMSTGRVNVGEALRQLDPGIH